jgi:hypothetical protein
VLSGVFVTKLSVKYIPDPRPPYDTASKFPGSYSV